MDDAPNMVCLLPLLASYRESAGYDVHHASAGGDRLVVLTTLGVADDDGASVLVGYDKPSNNGDCPEGSEKHIFTTNTRYAETWS